MTEAKPKPQPGKLRDFTIPSLKQSFLRVGIWGPPNSGKTTFGCSALDLEPPKKVGYLYTDESAVPIFKHYPDAVKEGRLLAKPCDSIGDIEDAVEDFELIPPKAFEQEFSAVVLDTVTDYYDWLVHKKAEELVQAGKSRGITLQLIPSDFRFPNRWLRKSLGKLLKLRCHVILVGKARELWESVPGTRDDTGATIRQPTGILNPQWKDQIIDYGCTEIVRLERRAVGEGKPRWYGVATKQKANIDVSIQIERITVPKLLNALQQALVMKQKEVKES